MNWSAWRRSSSAIIGGCIEVVEATLTRTPRRCTPPSPERHQVAREFHSLNGELDFSRARSEGPVAKDKPNRGESLRV
jgi:hypothetical protein